MEEKQLNYPELLEIFTNNEWAKGNITRTTKKWCEINNIEYDDGKRRKASHIFSKGLTEEDKPVVKRLFWDIETSPNLVYSWRIGYNLSLQPHDIVKERAIISIAYKWEHEDEVKILTWDENQCDKKMLEEFVEVLHSADESVAHNGKRFDEKWLRTRCIYHRIPTFPRYKSLDTLLKAKQGFNFNSNKLDYIAKYLGVGAKLQHEGFEMWRKIIEDKDPEALEAMCQYNKIDVIVLQDVYHALKSYVNPETHEGVILGKEKHSCPYCGGEESELLKNTVTTKGTIQRVMECNNCSSTFTIANSTYLKSIK